MDYEIMGFHLVNNSFGLKTIEEKHHKIDQLVPTMLEVKEDGELIIKKLRENVFDFFDKKNISPMIQNFALNSKVSNRLITKQSAINYLLDNLISYMSRYNYNDLCLNIEGVSYENKEVFTDFVKQITEALHNRGYGLSIAIPAKCENNQDSTWSGAYDYKALGEIVDKIIIMAYDFHWVGGPPGPIAPIFWIQDVIDFAIMEIPLEKIYLALGFYGYDWSINTDDRARGLVYRQVMNLVDRYNTNVEWDPDSQTPYVRYRSDGIKHEIWFENKESIAKKIKLLREFQLRGVAFWRLGQEDPDVWNIF
ncbi:glycosyl hydrolase family 18 protein [Natronospora cellulosivora (SeqCode)]